MSLVTAQRLLLEAGINRQLGDCAFMNACDLAISHKKIAKNCPNSDRLCELKTKHFIAMKRAKKHEALYYQLTRYAVHLSESKLMWLRTIK